jgi:hypothetical protein
MDPKTKQAKKIAQILKMFFILAGLMFVYIAFKFPPQRITSTQPAFELIISAVALIDVALGFILPGVLVRSALRAESGTRQSSTPIQRWFSGYVLSLAMFESCILFGLVLHFMGSRVLIVEVLAAAGLLAMLIRSPGSPPADYDVSNSQIQGDS